MASRKPRAVPKRRAPARDRQEEEHQRLRKALHAHRERLAAHRATWQETQQELDLSRAEYDELFAFAPQPAFVLDANGVVQGANVAGATLVGLDAARLVSVPMVVFVVEVDRRRFLDHMRRSRAADTAVTTEFVLRTRTGVEIPVEISSRPLTIRSDGHGLFHTTVFDLRERRRAARDRQRAADDRQRLQNERQLMRAESDAKDRFLAMLSHELRTPLTPVLLATSTWKDEPSLPTRIGQMLAMIHRNVAIEARLIDDLLDLTRITQNKLGLELEAVDFQAAAREVFESLEGEAEAAGVAASLDLQARSRVWGDPLRIRQIVWNLIRNAFQSTPRDGAVVVRTADTASGHVKLVVTDTGVGFEPEAVEHLFQPFDRGENARSRSGLGLGLAITKGLVEAQGGTIRAFSDGPGYGARFEVLLLAAKGRAGAVRVSAPTAETVPVAPAPLRILLVEDHEDTGLALSFVLEQQGYVVELARSIGEALDAAERFPIDMLVSDLGLPDGSGLELMRSLRKRRPLPGIALTGYGRREDVVDARDAGFDHHLTKPVDVATLIATIESLRRAAA